MNGEQFSLWFNKLGKAWEEKDPQAIPPLFAEKFEYYETPFDKPCTTKEGLLKLWQEVPDSQKDIRFSFKILSVLGNTGITHWQASFTRIKQNKKANLDGIFLVRLNQEGLCTLFKMWWVTKE